MTDETDRAAAFPVVRQLFPELDREQFEAFSDDAHRLFALWDGDEIVSVAGLSVRTVMHHERHVWLHDHVVDQAHRGQGHGSRLLSFVEK